MPADPRAGALRRIEAFVVRALETSTEVPLAFSGGLGSVLTAAVARKRGDLTCLVAGTAAAPDLEAAELAKTYLDYRVERIVLTGGACLRLARGVAREAPGLAPAEVLDLVPAMAVRARMRDREILVGCLPGSAPAASRSFRARHGLRAPLEEAFAGRAAPDRFLLSGVSDLLGLPRSFGHARRRRPGRGSGAETAVRAAARDRGASLGRLLRPRDFH